MKSQRQTDLGSVAALFESLFVGKATQGNANPTWPLQRKISWQQKGLKFATGEFQIDLPMSSGPQSEAPLFPATFLCPPACMIFTAQTDDGKPLFAYQPTVHVMGGVTISHVGATNATYTVRNLDSALQKDTLTPMNRWPGINYTALADGTLVLLMCSDTFTLNLIAFEKPVIVGCPGSPEPASARAGTSLASLIGL